MPPFESVVVEHGPTVLRVCRAVLGPVDAEDAWSETFLAALLAYPSLPPDANVEAWLVTIAHRKAIDVVRRRANRPVPVDRLPEHPTTEGVPGTGDREVWTAVAALPDRQRQAIAYHYLGGLPFGEVAAILGGTPDAARRAAHDGIRTLRRRHGVSTPARRRTSRPGTPTTLRFADAGPEVAAELCTWFTTPDHVLWWTGDRFGPALDPERVAEHIRSLGATAARSAGARTIGAWSSEDELLGYGELAPSPGHEQRLRLSRIGVSPAARGRGVGRALVDHLVATAVGPLGATVLELTVFTANETAVQLYRSIGFVTDEVLQGARTGHDGTLHDVAVMTLDAGPHAS